MKTTLIAASALLMLGSSAQAWAPTAKADTMTKADIQMKRAVLDVLAEAKAHAQLASAGSGYQGMGGPIAETGYPPCAPGPGDDRCIQLYEPGVTGAGN